MELEEEKKLRMTLEKHLTEQKKLEPTSSDMFMDSNQVYVMDKKHGNIS